LAPQTKVIAAEPAAADDALRSFESGSIQHCHDPRTIADGLRTTSIGERNFAVIARKVDGIVSVSEGAIIDAMRFLWERTKLVVEPSGAVAVAPLLEGKLQGESLRVGVILSGGNVDLESFFQSLATKSV
jgi:threonine dehydratase